MTVEDNEPKVKEVNSSQKSLVESLWEKAHPEELKKMEMEKKKQELA